MAIATYAQLQTAVASWLHRSDLTAIIPDFITLAESRLNRVLVLSDQETEASLTATTSSRYITVPTGYNKPVALWLTTYDPRGEMKYVLPEILPVSDTEGESEYWTIDKNRIATENPADQAYTYTFRYIAKYDIASSTTNSLLTAYPDLYLFGSLLESAPYCKDTSQVALWQNRYDLAMKDVQSATNSHRKIAPLRTDIAADGGGNIYRGY